MTATLTSRVWVSFGFVLSLSLSACNECVEKSKYAALQKQVTDTKKQLDELQSKLRKEPEEGTKPGRYETFHQGPRTFRFDSATGETCVLLTTGTDWKNQQTMAQSCDCQDVLRQWNNANLKNSESDEAKGLLAIMQATGCWTALNSKQHKH